jgi:hypothetical protein
MQDDICNIQNINGIWLRQKMMLCISGKWVASLPDTSGYRKYAQQNGLMWRLLVCNNTALAFLSRFYPPSAPCALLLNGGDAALTSRGK